MQLVIQHHGLIISCIDFFRAVTKQFWVVLGHQDISAASKIAEIILSWLDQRPRDICGSALLTDMTLIFAKDIEQMSLLKVANELQSELTRQLRSFGDACSSSSHGESNTKLSFETELLSVKLSSVAHVFIFENYEPVYLAKYLAATSLLFFRGILETQSYKYWLSNSKSNYKGKQEHLRAFDNVRRRDNMLTHWITAKIVHCRNAEEALDNFQLLIETAEELRCLRDFNTMFCIMNALAGVAAQSALEQTTGLDQVHLAIWKVLLMYTDSTGDQYAIYRSVCKTPSRTPIVPFINLFLNDLASIRVGDYTLARYHENTFQEPDSVWRNREALGRPVATNVIDIEKLRLSKRDNLLFAHDLIAFQCKSIWILTKHSWSLTTNFKTYWAVPHMSLGFTLSMLFTKEV